MCARARSLAILATFAEQSAMFAVYRRRHQEKTMEMFWAITRSHNVGRIFGIRDFRSWREFMRSAPLLFSLFLLREQNA